MHEFTSKDREDVTRLLTDVVDRVVDELIDNPSPDMMYKLYAQFILATARMIEAGKQQGGMLPEDHEVDRALRVIELFKDVPMATKTWDWRTDSPILSEGEQDNG